MMPWTARQSSISYHIAQIAECTLTMMYWAESQGNQLSIDPVTPGPAGPPLSSPLHSTPLHSTPLHSSPLTPLHSTPLYCTPLHSIPLHSTALHCTALHTHRSSPLLCVPCSDNVADYLLLLFQMQMQRHAARPGLVQQRFHMLHSHCSQRMDCYPQSFSYQPIIHEIATREHTETYRRQDARAEPRVCR